MKRGDLHTPLYSEHIHIEAQVIAMNSTERLLLCMDVSLQAAAFFSHQEDEDSSADI